MVIGWCVIVVSCFVGGDESGEKSKGMKRRRVLSFVVVGRRSLNFSGFWIKNRNTAYYKRREF